MSIYSFKIITKIKILCVFLSNPNFEVGPLDDKLAQPLEAPFQTWKPLYIGIIAPPFGKKFVAFPWRRNSSI